MCAWVLAAGTKYILLLWSSSETTLKGMEFLLAVKSPFSRRVPSVAITLFVFLRVLSAWGREMARSLAPSQEIRTDDLKFLYINEALWLQFFWPPKGGIGVDEPSGWSSSGKCSTVEILCFGWNGIPDATLGIFHCGIWSFLFLWIVSHEHIFIPWFFFRESKSVLSHACCAQISSRVCCTVD